MQLLIKVIIFTCLLQNMSFAQTIHGKVFEKQSETPIPFSSIYVPNKVGVNCDENGQFQISLDNILPSDSITISCVGYKTVNMPKSEFVQNTTFFLVENTELLNAITIKPTGKEVILGRKQEGGIGKLIVFLNEKIRDSIKTAELGVIIDNKHRVLLKEVGFYLKDNTFDALTFRLNVYNMKDKSPNENILQKDVRVSIREKKKGWFTFDLSNQHVVIADDFACTIEILNWSYQGGKFMMSAPLSLLNKKVIWREFSKGSWIKAPINLGMYAKGVEVK